MGGATGPGQGGFSSGREDSCRGGIYSGLRGGARGDGARVETADGVDVGAGDRAPLLPARPLDVGQADEPELLARFGDRVNVDGGAGAANGGDRDPLLAVEADLDAGGLDLG